MSSEAFSTAAPKGGGFTERALAWVERAGNRVPDPAILFAGLIVMVIVLSQVLDWANVGATSQVAEPPAAQVTTTENSYDPPQQHDGEEFEVKSEHVEAKGLLTGDGISFMFSSFVSNFLGFAAVGVILVAMIGVGVAEHSGLIGALIRKLVAISSPACSPTSSSSSGSSPASPPTPAIWC